MSKNLKRIALIGNPNTGKTSLFNILTGLKQKTGNYPGVTVDKKSSVVSIDNTKVEIIDLPGTYSLCPKSQDESIVLETLAESDIKLDLDLIVLVADATKLKKSLYLFKQLKELGIPIVIALNMFDIAVKSGYEINVEGLSRELGVTIVPISARKKDGIQDLRSTFLENHSVSEPEGIELGIENETKLFSELDKYFESKSEYIKWVLAAHINDLSHFVQSKKETVSDLIKQFTAHPKRLITKDSLKKYKDVQMVLDKYVLQNKENDRSLSSKMDKILTHKIGGYFIFFAIMFLMFQSVFSWAAVPMGWIEELVQLTKDGTSALLGEGSLNNLLTNGLIPGIEAVIIFIPQIAILFFFIALLEESGYLSRVVVMMDRFMLKFGMSGKSVIPVISGTACAIPAIMATRNIANWKERLITILTLPLVTCSARLPVYTVIIAVVIPNDTFMGVGLQGLALFGLYLIGFLGVFLSGFILRMTLKFKANSSLILDLPTYKLPIPMNVFTVLVNKTKSFVYDAGKIILVLSIVLWLLASYGPGDKMEYADSDDFKKELIKQQVPEEEIGDRVASLKLESSYLGIMGKSIEPVIEPLGYDWKIGIALIASFSAREVFNSTLSSIYSIGSDENGPIIERLRKEKNPKTGELVYSFATGMSLLIFYVFAMQCVGTLAVVKKETNSWKWPLVQFGAYTAFAYIFAFVTYQFLK
jgi:ferrous iron transport protein B